MNKEHKDTVKKPLCKIMDKLREAFHITLLISSSRTHVYNTLISHQLLLSLENLIHKKMNRG